MRKLLHKSATWTFWIFCCLQWMKMVLVYLTKKFERKWIHFCLPVRQLLQYSKQVQYIKEKNMSWGIWLMQTLLILPKNMNVVWVQWVHMVCKVFSCSCRIAQEPYLYHGNIKSWCRRVRLHFLYRLIIINNIPANLKKAPCRSSFLTSELHSSSASSNELSNKFKDQVFDLGLP